MNTIASVGRLYRIKLAQQKSSYLTYQWESGTVAMCQQLLPIVTRLYQLSDENSMVQYRGLFSPEWGKTWEEINKALTMWVNAYNQQSSSLQPSEMLNKFISTVVTANRDMINAYSKPLGKEKYSQIAGWMEKNIGSYVQYLFGRYNALSAGDLREKSSKSNADQFLKEINLIEKNIEGLQDHFEEMGINEADPRIGNCKKIVENLDDLSDLFEDTFEAQQDAQNDPLKMQKVNMAWNQVKNLLDSIKQSYDYLLDSQISPEENKGEITDATKARRVEILEQVTIMYQNISEISQTRVEQLSREEAYLRDTYNYGAQ